MWQTLIHYLDNVERTIAKVLGPEYLKYRICLAVTEHTGKKWKTCVLISFDKKLVPRSTATAVMTSDD